MKTSNGVKKYIFSFFILVLAMIFSPVLIYSASAQDSDASVNAPADVPVDVPSDALSKLTYPIVELGDCKDRDDCKIYCDDSANAAACVNYGEKKDLFSQEELKVAKKFVEVGTKGPGNCNGKEECQTYCEDSVHIDECVSYAEDNDLMSVQDLQKAKKVQMAIKKGVKFPSCNNKKECDIYCEESSHMEECITFAKEAGFLSDKELVNTEKVLIAIKQGVNPPACKGKEACDIYCAEESNVGECTNFAVAAGLVTSEQAKLIKETGGKGPGGCKNKRECDSYCSNTANGEVCSIFAKEHNIPQPPRQSGQTKPDGTGPGNGAGQGQGGPGNNNGGGGQSGWSNGTGNGGGNGGPDSQGGGQGGPAGGPNQGQGFNPGSGQGGGQNANPNPTKCIEDCEYVGKICAGQAGDKSKVCASEGQYCRTVTCETFGAGGTRPTTQEEWNRCASYCRTIEDNCYAGISPTDGECTTAKDVCVMECQKASKPTKPTQPSQPGQPAQPTKPTPPAQPAKPTPPAQNSQPAQSPEGKCGDGICGKMEQADSTLCPQDCGGSAQPAQPSQQTPPTQPTQSPAGKCGDGICGRMELADPTLCPQDCGR